MTACPILPIQLNQPNRWTLANTMELIDRRLTQRIEEAAARKKAKIREGDSAAFWERTALRTAFRHLVTMLDRPLDLIDLEEIVDLTTEDYEQKLGVTHRRAIWHLWAQNKILYYSALDGWSCDAWRRRQAWVPIREALAVTWNKEGRVKQEKFSAGCQGIVDFADRNGKWPHEFDDDVMKAWWDHMLYVCRRDLRTVEDEERSFRKKIRRAARSIQKLLQNFNFKSKHAAPYYLPLERMPKELREEIEDIVDWKLNRCPFKFRIRNVTAASLRDELRAICGYVILELGICGITSLRQVITAEYIDGFIAWRHEPRKDDRNRKPKCSWTTIRSMLGAVNAVIRQGHPLFAKQVKEYAWLDDRIRKIPRETRKDKQERRTRKMDKSVLFDTFCEIARNIRRELDETPNLNPLEKAKLFRNYLFCLALSKHPWRQRNWRECWADLEDASANICCQPIPDDVVADMNLPESAQKIYDDDPEHPFILAHFTENATKGNREIWELIDQDLYDPIRIYLSVHRPELARCGPGGVNTFLVSNGGNAMSKNDMVRLMASLSLRYLPEGKRKRLTPHIVRDIVAENALAHGCTFKGLQAMLWHTSQATERYLSCFNASHAAVVQEGHLTGLGLGRI